MNHKNGFNPLSRTSAHRRAMSRNMVTSLFRYERITTTKAKAAEVKKAAEKLITRSKIDSVHNRREAAKFILDDIILAKLFAVIGPRMKDRAGGYTRTLKLGFRDGDAADMVILELVDFKLDVEGKKEKTAAKAAKKTAKTEAAEKDEAAKSEEQSKEKKAPAKKAAPKKAAATKVKTDAKPAAEKKTGATRKTSVRKSAKGV